jgi:hypothetical protein
MDPIPRVIMTQVEAVLLYHELDHVKSDRPDNRSLIQNATGARGHPRYRERADDQNQQMPTPPARAPGAGWRSSGPAGGPDL